MATIPVLPTYAVGSRWTAARALEVKAAIDFHNNRPSASVSRIASAQSIGNGASAAIQFDTEDFDTDGMATLGTNNDRLTVVTPGLYLVEGAVAFAANGTGNRIAFLTKNGGAVARQATGAVTVNVPSVSVSKLVRAVIGDYFTLLGYQNSGGALNTALDAGGCFLQATWIAA